MIEAVFCLPAVFIISALIISLAGRKLPFYAIPVGVLASLYSLGLSAGLFKAAAQDSIVLPAELNLDWFGIPFLGSPLALRLDGMSMLALFAVCAVGVMVHLVSAGQIAKDRSVQRYFAMLSLFMASITGMLVTTNLLLVALCWELMAVSAAVLITHRYQRAETVSAAVYHFIMSRTGGLFLLAAVLVAMVSFGTVGVEQILKLQRINLVGSAGVAVMSALLLCAVMCRTGVLPFTSFSAGIAAAPPPAAALIAVTSGFGAVYLAVRFVSFFMAAGGVSPAALWLGLAGGALAACCSLRERDAVKAVVYCVSAEFGLAVAVLGAGGGQQALFHAFCVTFSGALLICAAGLAAFVCKKGELSEMGGLRCCMPVVHLVFFTGALTLAGVPPFSGYFSKTFMGLVFQQVPGALPAALVVYLLSAMSIFRVLLRIFYGEKGKMARRAPEYEGPGSTSGTLIFAAVAGAFMGIMLTRRNVFSAMLSMPENPMPFAWFPAVLASTAAIAAFAAVAAVSGERAEGLRRRLARFHMPECDANGFLVFCGAGVLKASAALDRFERGIDGGLASFFARVTKNSVAGRFMRGLESALLRQPETGAEAAPARNGTVVGIILTVLGLGALVLIAAAIW